MGCGAYRCPPRLVAEEMKAALQEPEFKDWFRRVVFAIYSNPQNGPGNFDVFKEVFQGVQVPVSNDETNVGGFGRNAKPTIGVIFVALFIALMVKTVLKM
jgi:hypothetical protein